MPVPRTPRNTRLLVPGGAGHGPLGSSTRDGFRFLRKTAGGYVLTCGMVADALGVAPRTAAKWIDGGGLPGWRIPGSMDRRVYAHDLLKFMRGNGQTPPAGLVRLIEGKLELAAVGVSASTADLLTRTWSGCVPLSGLFDAGAHTAGIDTGVLVVGPLVLSSEVSPVVSKLLGRWAVVRQYAPDQEPPVGGTQGVCETNLDALVKIVDFLLKNPVTP